jgi:hypothetical protein
LLVGQNVNGNSAWTSVVPQTANVTFPVMSATTEFTFSAGNIAFGYANLPDEASGYFQSFSTGSSMNVSVTTAFRGLGLPQLMYNRWTTLIDILAGGGFDCSLQMYNGTE